MPLSCQSGDESICSIEYETSKWDELRALNAAEDRLRLNCCGSRVTLKTSKLGTRFFAHKQRGECTSASETAERLFVKACSARAWRRRASRSGSAWWAMPAAYTVQSLKTWLSNPDRPARCEVVL